MKPMYAIRSAAAAIFLITATGASAQEAERAKITEEDKQTFRDFKDAAAKQLAEKSAKELRFHAISNLRQIGLAFFEFETEYGSFPNEETAEAVKEAAGFKGELGATTANDCFFQVIAAGIVENPRIFTFEGPAKLQEAVPKPAAPARLEKCSFAFIALPNAAGDPGRPLAVAPLVQGKTTFDRKVFGARALILRVDNSVSTYPITDDGRVIINGRDLFDPEQPFWKGDVPPIKWPAE